MPRQPKLAPGLARLALSLGLVVAFGVLPRPAPAQQQQHEAAPKARDGGAMHAVKSTLKNAEHSVESTLKKVEHSVEDSLHEAAHSAATHETAGEPDILQPQPNLALWTVVVFVGLFLVLRTFAWKPLSVALHQREEHIEHALHETERARNEGEALLAEHRRRLAASEDQIRAMIEEARRNAAAAADEIIKKAQAEADASRQRAEREIGVARDQALSDIWTKTTDLAVSVAGKVLDRSLTEDDHRRLVDAAVGALPDVRPSTNGHGGLTA